MPSVLEVRPRDEFPRKAAEPAVLPMPRLAQKPADPDESAFGPRDVLNALRYHLVLFLTLGTITAAIGAAVGWHLFPAKYTTYAMIRVAAGDPKLLESAVPGGGRGDLGTYLRTQAGLIKSYLIVNRALRDQKVASLPMLRDELDPVAFLEERLELIYSEGSEIMRVAMAGEDPVQITAVVNSVVDAFMHEVQTDSEGKHKRIERLEKQKRETSQILEARIKQRDSEFGTPTAGEMATTTKRVRMAKYLQLQQDKSALQLQMARAKEQLSAAEARLRQAIKAVVAVPDLETTVDAQPVVREKTERLRNLDAAIMTHRRTALDVNASPYPELKAKRDRTVQELNAIRQEIAGKIVNAHRQQRLAEFDLETEKWRREVDRIDMEQRLNLQQFAEYKDLEEEEIAPKLAANRLIVEDEIRNYREIFNSLEANIRRLHVELDSPDRVKLLQRAEVPHRKEMKKQLAFTGFGAVAGFGLVGGLITVGELRRKRVYSAAEPLFAAKLPLLGRVPETDPRDPAFLQAIDRVKAVLARQIQRRGLRTILVTSAAPDEGKSVVAWSLASALARTDHKTLFIDADLLHPALHHHESVSPEPGLCELLRNDCTFAEAAQPTALPNLWCLTAGRCDDDARLTLDKDRLQSLLDRALQEFDFVILDSCAAGEAVDPLYLAVRADGAVLALRVYRSRVGAVEQLCQRLHTLGVPVLGAVLGDPTYAGGEA